MEALLTIYDMSDSREKTPDADDCAPPARPSGAPTEPKSPDQNLEADVAKGNGPDRSDGDFPTLSAWEQYERHRRLILDEWSLPRSGRIDIPDVDTDSPPRPV